MMTTYYNHRELEAATKVSDKELNDLLQEIRAIDPRYHLVERVLITKKWFRKSTQKTVYSLLLLLDDAMECQVINFSTDDPDCDTTYTCSIRTYVPKSYIMTLFYGWLNGYKFNHK